MQFIAFASLALFMALCARADEGMWTFDNLPLAQLKERYAFTPTQAWLDHVRLSAISFTGGSASFISKRGLVITNHHVGADCIAELSSEGKDLVTSGFLAASLVDELKCPATELKSLVSFEDVTRQVGAAVKPGATNEQSNAQRKAAIAAIENDCAATSGLRCEVITLYHGFAYHLYRYKVWQDVRLVFAPEKQIAFFGGDADNFVYPRFDLDVAIFRVYEGNRPVEPAAYLRWSSTGIRDGELVFAVGHPGETGRQRTVAEFIWLRDVYTPMRIAGAERQLAVLRAFSARSPEAARRAEERLLGTENWLKSMRGEYKALRDPALLRAKQADEKALRRRLAADATRGQTNSDPWRSTAEAVKREEARAKEFWAVDYGYKSLFSLAGQIVELANERARPESERLAAYREAKIPALLTRLTSTAPIYKDLEIARMSDRFAEARKLLGERHPFVRTVLDGREPENAATRVIEGSSLDDAVVRKQLVDGGKAPVNASRDPLIVLARNVYPIMRELKQFGEEKIDTPKKQAAEKIGIARFKAFGTAVSPDATNTMRLSFGKVSGYEADGLATPWATSFYGLYARATAFENRSPFDLPPRWRERESRLDLATPYNFVATLDTTGGNSGSPIVDRNGELVGLLFDGNLQSLVWDYVYTDKTARSVIVDIRAIVEALAKIYDAPELLRELTTGQ